MIWGAPNFCPKNDLMHQVLHEKSIGFSIEIEVFSKKKKKRSSLTLRWFFATGVPKYKNFLPEFSTF